MTEKKPSEHTHRWAPDLAGEPFDDGFVVFYTPGEHYMEFIVLVIETYDDERFYYGCPEGPDPDTDEAPLLWGSLKWDGCMNVTAGYQHFCGLGRALVLERAMRRLYALGAEHIEKWDE